MFLVGKSKRHTTEYSYHSSTHHIPVVFFELNSCESMANIRKFPRKSVNEGKENSYTLYFIKDCNCGEIINERLLPNFVRESNLTTLFAKCIECLIFANTRLNSKKFVDLLIRAVGKYSEILIENQIHLRQLLDKICDACKACPNFIHEAEIKSCPLCDSEEKSPPKEVLLVAFFLCILILQYFFSRQDYEFGPSARNQFRDKTVMRCTETIGFFENNDVVRPREQLQHQYEEVCNIQ